MARTVPIGVVETPEFLSATSKLMTDDERALLVDYLAYKPTSGDLIPGTGGVRKLRWGSEGRGKRGGARVIYFHHDAGMPLFALTAYAKNERADLSQQDRNDFRQLTALLVERFTRGESHEQGCRQYPTWPSGSGGLCRGEGERERLSRPCAREDRRKGDPGELGHDARRVRGPVRVQRQHTAPLGTGFAPAGGADTGLSSRH